jgi:PKD repeat protein
MRFRRTNLRVEQLESRLLLSQSAQFDFGTAWSPAAPGYLKAALVTYAPARGSGWESVARLTAHDRGTADSLTRDLHRGPAGTFLVDLPNGTYRVTATLGDAFVRRDQMAIWAEGRKVASDLTTNAGQFVRPSFQVAVTDGQLNLRFVDEGGNNPYFTLAALEVERVDALPTLPPDPGDPVPPPPAPPTANAGPDRTLNEADPVTFTGQASGTSPLSYAWDFGDGSSGSGTLTPSHTYQDNGTYTVTLTVTDANGLTAQDVAVVTVNNLPPTATVGPFSGQVGTPIAFTANATDPSPADRAAGLTYVWDFGDGTTGNGQTPSHAYTAEGLYQVLLTVSDKDGGSTTVSTTAAVSAVGNQAPVLSPTGSVTVAEGATRTVVITASDPDADPLSFSASGLPAFATFTDRGDGTAALTLTPPLGSAGSYAVTVTVADRAAGDPDRRTASTTVAITVAPAGAASADVISTNHDTIPNFGASPTIISVTGGAWSDVRTWSAGRLPTDGDIVAIAPNTVVTYDQVRDVQLDTLVVQPGGVLTFRTDVDTRVVVGNFLVLEGGRLEIGTEARPVAADVTAEVIIADQAIDTGIDPKQYGTGLLVWGEVRMHGAVKEPTFVRLAVEPKAGDTTLTLEQPVTGWQPGDRLVLPPTEAVYLCCAETRTEELTISAVNGAVVTLTAPLQRDHKGARDGAGQLTFLPHVGNLTRNVLLRSENPLGTRGHTFFTHRADVDIRYVQFKDLGRTTGAPLDSTTLDAEGNVTRIGTNQIGRYTLHMHHVMGPVNPANEGYQYQLIGNSLDGGRKWGLAVHDSHYGLIQENVLYNFEAAGIATEDGSESYNLFERNFVVRVTEGDGFWLQGTRNYFRDNVVASAFGAERPGNSYYTPPNLDNNLVLMVPTVRGADMESEAQTEEVYWSRTTFLEFAGNEGYSSDYGLWLDHRHGGAEQGGHYIKDFRAWAMYSGGVAAYDTDGVIYDGLILRGIRPGAGVFVTSNIKTVVRNADIQGCDKGIWYTGAGTELVVEDSYLRNSVNVLIDLAPTTGAFFDSSFYKTAVLRNVKFEAPLGQPLRAITMEYRTDSRVPVMSNTVYVYDYNQQPGVNFQVFFKEQAPDYIVPYEGDIPADPIFGKDNVAASPEPGLTNQQAWEKYGIAIAGGVAPNTDATTRPEIDGFTAPLP